MRNSEELEFEWEILTQIPFQNWSITDLHLAAELGKTLLERNRELESTVKELRILFDEKVQEVEYLSKQTAALREVNDSRLRIYEQLEISIQELEKSNQRLTAEANSDKKKIKSLNEHVEQIESKYEELKEHQAEVNSLKKLRSPSVSGEAGSEGNGTFGGHRASQDADSPELLELKAEVENLQERLKTSQDEFKLETKRREDLEVELSCITQENYGLKEQLAIYKENQYNSKPLDDEFTSPDTTTSSMFCRKCMGLVDETCSNLTMQDITEDFEDIDEAIEGTDKDCTLIRLKNGGYAWGSQESMASMGFTAEESAPKNLLSRSHVNEAPNNSLLSELDSQYRILIEKYESLVGSNEHNESGSTKQYESDSFFHTGVDEGSGPMGFIMTSTDTVGLQENLPISCQRCSTCTCEMQPFTEKLKPQADDYLEHDASSSGFSDEKIKFCAKATQTDIFEVPSSMEDSQKEKKLPITLSNTFQCLDLKSPMNPCETRFQNTPEVQKLFSEIFENLRKTSETPKRQNQSTIASANDKLSHKTSRKSRSSSKKSNKENVQLPELERDLLNRDDMSCLLLSKPDRPDSLNLETSSTCSSRGSRRRRRRRRENSQDNKNINRERSTNSEDKCTSSCRETETERSRLKSVEQKINNVDTLKSNESQPKNAKPESSNGAPNATGGKNKLKCPHKKKKQSKSQSNHLQNKHLNNALGRNSPSKTPVKTKVKPSKSCQGSQLLPGTVTAPPLPSIQVAKLIKVEKSYAEVLKSKPTWHQTK